MKHRAIYIYRERERERDIYRERETHDEYMDMKLDRLIDRHMERMIAA